MRKEDYHHIVKDGVEITYRMVPRVGCIGRVSNEDYDLRHMESVFPRHFISPRSRRTQKKIKRYRPRRRGRLTWQAWWGDWLKALRSKGWECCYKGLSNRTYQLTLEQLKSIKWLCLYRDGIALYLHISPDNVIDWANGSNLHIDTDMAKQIKRKIHIVRGRQADASRNIRKGEGNIAYNIAPLARQAAKTPHLIEFDEKLYDGKIPNEGWFYSDPGPWIECTDPEVVAIYSEYLAGSPHHSSIRAYNRQSKRKVELEALVPQMPSISASSQIDANCL